MFQCKDLLTLPSMAKARIIAGKSGLSNRIRWVYKPENMNFAKWVKGQELLIISTPVIQSKDFDLQAVIKKAKKLDMAGALLLVGDKYIASIDSTIISYSNLNDFPIFVISGEIPLVDIFEEIGHAIAYNKDSDVLSDDILSGIIFGKDINIEAFSIKFEEAGYDINGNNRMFMINIHSDNKIENFDYDFIMNKLRDSCAQNNGSLILSRYANNIVGCFNCLENADDTHGLINQSYEALSEYVQGRYTDIKLVMGIGREYNGISHLQKSFTEASRCVILSEKIQLNGSVFWYEEMGIYNLFSEFGDKKLIQDFVDSTLGIIIDYDKENNTNLLQTLKAYLWNNNSLLHASEQLFTHRNTVKYRIQRITELTGRNFDDAMTRLEFMNALICLEVR